MMISLLINTACAYHFGAVKRTIPGSYDRVAVPVFKNNTSETAVETYFTKSMIEEIERGHIAHITGKENAQVVIEGSLNSVQYLAGAQVKPEDKGFESLPRGTVLTKEYRILVTGKIDVRRVSDQKIIWTGGFSGERRYPAPLVTNPAFLTVNPLYNHSSRHQNIEVMARDLMAESYSRLTENF